MLIYLNGEFRKRYVVSDITIYTNGAILTADTFTIQVGNEPAKLDGGNDIIVQTTIQDVLAIIRVNFQLLQLMDWPRNLSMGRL